MGEGSVATSIAKKILIVIGVLVAAFFTFGFYMGSTPDGKARAKDRMVID